MKAETMEEQLLEMRRFGQVRMNSYDDGTWSCSMEAMIPGTGTTLEIKSGFDQRSPASAVALCFERFSKAMLNVTQPQVSPNLISST